MALGSDVSGSKGIASAAEEKVAPGQRGTAFAKPFIYRQTWTYPTGSTILLPGP